MLYTRSGIFGSVGYLEESTTICRELKVIAFTKALV